MYSFISNAIILLDENINRYFLKDRHNRISCKGMEFTDLMLSLAYPLILVIISAIYAIKIRKVPAGYNEARRIGFAVYTTLVIWLAQVCTFLDI